MHDAENQTDLEAVSRTQTSSGDPQPHLEVRRCQGQGGGFPPPYTSSAFAARGAATMLDTQGFSEGQKD